MTTGASAVRCSTPRPSSLRFPTPYTDRWPNSAGSSLHTASRVAPTVLPGRGARAGLSPDAVLRTYNIQTLRDARRQFEATVVVFAFDGFDQADLDSYSGDVQSPALHPRLVGRCLKPAAVRPRWIWR